MSWNYFNRKGIDKRRKREANEDGEKNMYILISG